MARPPQTTTVDRAKQCLAKAAPIPGAPMWTMFKAAKLDSQSDFDLLQNAIDYLTCKGQARMAFTDEEKGFLSSFYSDLAYGGRYYMGFREAADLTWHYLEKTGERFQVDAAVYQSSVIVKDACEAIKDYIRERIRSRRNFDIVRTTDPGFIDSPQASRLKRPGRDTDRQGYMYGRGDSGGPAGWLLTEQSNGRLKNTNNRFPLAAQTTMGSDNAISTRWRVDDRYEFQPFTVSDAHTELTLGSRRLKLPDGLSHYLTVLDLAKEFEYWSEWQERWNA